jgi:hypothetical protein
MRGLDAVWNIERYLPHAVRLFSHNVRGCGAPVLGLTRCPFHPLHYDERKVTAGGNDLADVQPHLRPVRQYGAIQFAQFDSTTISATGLRHEARLGLVTGHNRVEVSGVECLRKRRVNIRWIVRMAHLVPPQGRSWCMVYAHPDQLEHS